MRAIFTSFDNFMVMFVAMFGVFWSTVFMPLLGGPLHTYEARALGAGWESLQSGEAANIREAFEIAASIPAEAVFPSAHAQELPLTRVVETEQMPLELLGGPEVDTPAMVMSSTRGVRARHASTRVTRISSAPMVEIEAAPGDCDAAALKRGLCEPTATDLLAANT